MPQLTGVYSRKLVEFPDLHTLNKAVAVINQAPWTIVNSPDWAADYISCYGQDEFNVLKASLSVGKPNMVQSYVATNVQGGAWIAAVPKAEEALGPDEEWVSVPTPFGVIRRKVKKGSVPLTQKVAGDVDLGQLEAIVFTQAGLAVEAVLRKHGLIG